MLYDTLVKCSKFMANKKWTDKKYAKVEKLVTEMEQVAKLVGSDTTGKYIKKLEKLGEKMNKILEGDKIASKPKER